MSTTNAPTAERIDEILRYHESGVATADENKELAAEVRRLRAQDKELRANNDRIVRIAEEVESLFTPEERGMHEPGTWQVRMTRGIATLRAHIAELMSYRARWSALERKVEDTGLHIGSRCDDGETCVYIVAMRGKHYTGSTLIDAVDAAMEDAR